MIGKPGRAGIRSPGFVARDRRKRVRVNVDARVMRARGLFPDERRRYGHLRSGGVA